MEPFVQAFEFRGTASTLAVGTLLLQAVAVVANGAEALLWARLTFLADQRFEEQGTLSFGGLDTLQFRSLQPGELAAGTGTDLSHGIVLLKVASGGGAFAHASGRIVSNFLLSTTGEFTDRSIAVLFRPGHAHVPLGRYGQDDAINASR